MDSNKIEMLMADPKYGAAITNIIGAASKQGKAQQAQQEADEAKAQAEAMLNAKKMATTPESEAQGRNEAYNRANPNDQIAPDNKYANTTAEQFQKNKNINVKDLKDAGISSNQAKALYGASDKNIDKYYHNGAMQNAQKMASTPEAKDEAIKATQERRAKDKYANLTYNDYWAKAGSPGVKDLKNAGWTEDEIREKFYSDGKHKDTELTAELSTETKPADTTPEEAKSADDASTKIVDKTIVDDKSESKEDDGTTADLSTDGTAKRVENEVQKASNAQIQINEANKDIHGNLTKENMADYAERAKKYEQPLYASSKSIVKAYNDGEIDKDTMKYYLGDAISTALLNIGSIYKGGTGGATSKWQTAQEDVQGKQRNLAYNQKGTDLANEQSLNASGANAQQTADNSLLANTDAYNMYKDKYLSKKYDIDGIAKAYSDPTVQADVKEFLTANGGNGVLIYEMVNGGESAQAISSVLLSMKEEDRQKIIDGISGLAGALGKGAGVFSDAVAKVADAASGFIDKTEGRKAPADKDLLADGDNNIKNGKPLTPAQMEERKKLINNLYSPDKDVGTSRGMIHGSLLRGNDVFYVDDLTSDELKQFVDKLANLMDANGGVNAKPNKNMEKLYASFKKKGGIKAWLK